jgi:hypothetical protein
MGRQALVGMWAVVGVSVANLSALPYVSDGEAVCVCVCVCGWDLQADLRAISPSEGVWEPPRANFCFRLTLCLFCHRGTCIADVMLEGE